MRAVGALVAVSCLGGCMIGMLTGTRVVAALGDDGGLLRGLAARGPAGTPDRAIAATAALAMAYGASTRLGRRPYRVPGYPWVPGIFVAFSAAFLVLTMVNDVNSYRAAVAAGQPAVVNFALGTVLVIAGVPVYWYYRRKQA